MIDTDPRDLIERMCACLHGWNVLCRPAANSPTLLLVDEARRYLAQSEPKPPSLKEQALEELDGIAAVFRMSHGGDLVCDKIRRALEQLEDN